jgi:protein O-mannosyl-transferase
VTRSHRNRTRKAHQGGVSTRQVNGCQASPIQPPSRAHLALAVITLGLLAVVPYLNSLDNGFVWDDHQQVVMNPALAPDVAFSRVFAANAWGFWRAIGARAGSYYRPFALAAYRLIADGFGFQPRAFHTVNVASHALVVLLVFALSRELTGRIGISFLAAALFAVHPVHTEAVDWIAGLSDIACTAFVVAALLALVLARKLRSREIVGAERHGSAAWLSASYITFAASLLWKEAAMVFPLIVIAYVFCLASTGPIAHRLWNSVKPSLVFWGILGADLVLRWNVLGLFVRRLRDWNLDGFQVALTTLNLLCKYWLKLIAPVHLNAYYVFSPLLTLASPAAILTILLVIAGAFGIVAAMTRMPLATFATLWVCITLLPALDIYALGRNVFAERYLYLPSVGFCLLIAVVAVQAAETWLPAKRRWASAVLAASVLVLCIWQDINRNRVWRDDATLFTTTLKSSPDAPFLENMVASFQPNDGKGQISSEAHYLRAIFLAEREAPPDRLQIDIADEALAAMYAGRGDFERALKALDQVRANDPQDLEVDGEAGLILAQAGRWGEAEAALRRAVIVEPNDANVLNALGLIAWQHHHDLNLAADLFLRALAAHQEPDDFRASLYSNLGSVYGEESRFADAIAQFNLALQITPDDPGYLTNLAVALEASGRVDDAIAKLRAALAIAPDYAPARTSLEGLLRQSAYSKERPRPRGGN